MCLPGRVLSMAWTMPPELRIAGPMIGQVRIAGPMTQRTWTAPPVVLHVPDPGRGMSD